MVLSDIIKPINNEFQKTIYMDLAILLLWTIAPVVQITLSTLRVKGRVGLPIIAGMILSFMLGVVLTIISLKFVPLPPPSPSGFRCGMLDLAVLFIGVFIHGISALIIGIISYIAYCIKTKNDRKLQPPVIS